ncbi:MAG: M3 family oligoendopeptidase [Myxococcales bacterium]|nr:M3 family oligoendopeptidase [Myxococcales bacterium]
MKRRFLVLAFLVSLLAGSAAWTLSAAAPDADPFAAFPANSDAALTWPWEKIAVYFDALDRAPLTAETVAKWLTDWTSVAALLSEIENRLYLDMSADTADAAAEKRYTDFYEQVRTPAEQRQQNLRARLLASGLCPAGFELPLRKMRAQAELFRSANLPLLVDQEKLNNEYNKILGAQTVQWEGKETTISELDPVYQQTDRDRREQAWRLAMQRWQQDRAAIGNLWGQFLQLRRQLASNAGFADYRAYRWQDMMRFDYTPADVKRFHENIRRVVVPAAQRIYEKRRQRLGVDRLRPWDLDVDPLGRAPLKPFATATEFENKTQATFTAVDPRLGAYFATMRREKTLDLDNRKGKSPGGFCTGLDLRRLPYIFMNAVGVHDDVQTILHEGGHAFHYFETYRLPWFQQRWVPMEFDEVASMSMELLAGMHLDEQPGGFYSPKDAARARIVALEGILLFWPYMSVVDSFQHWVYEHPDEAAEPKNCDRAWAELWDQYMRGVDWSGLEAARETGWQRKLHIHTVPFYYIEYGIAELGAVQVFGRALQNPQQALTDYLKALSLGGTVSLPQLFATAGVKFSLDETTLAEAVALLERTIAELEKVAGS